MIIELNFYSKPSKSTSLLLSYKRDAFIISIFCGLFMMLVMSSIFYYFGKLQSSWTLKLKNALHQIGEVYLTVGKERSSIGKVSITIQGSLRELEALTEENRDLIQGDVVKVKEVTENGILIIELLNK